MEGNGEVEIERIPGDHKGTIIGILLGICMIVKFIEIRVYRKGTYILADIHGMNHFGTKLAPRPYNKPRSCVSKIHTPMVMVLMVW
jgi:hypothetical protein